MYWSSPGNITFLLYCIIYLSQFGTPTAPWKKDGGASAASQPAVPGAVGTTATAAAIAKPGTQLGQGQKKLDVNTVGLINGQPIYEFDMDAEQDEKAWRKPGYFSFFSYNY